MKTTGSKTKPRLIDISKVITQTDCMRALIRKHGYSRDKCIRGFAKAFEEGLIVRIRDTGKYSIEEYANIVYCGIKSGK